jgi:hypothetical protein
VVTKIVKKKNFWREAAAKDAFASQQVGDVSHHLETKCGRAAVGSTEESSPTQAALQS